MLKYILSISLVITLAGCCATNYSSQMKEILKPMEKELIAFYKKNNRRPTNVEYNKLLEKAGCKLYDYGYECLYRGNDFSIHKRGNADGGSIALLKGNSYCYVEVYNSKKSLIKCEQRSCFDIRIDH